MSFPTTGVLDNTTRANENPLSNGGKWTTPIRTGDEKLQLVANKVGAAGTTSSLPNGAWTNQTFGPSAEAWFTINSWDTLSAGTSFFAFVNVQAVSVASPVYYQVELLVNASGAPGNLFLRRSGASGWNVVAGTGGLPLLVAAGDQLGLRSNGRIIEAWFQHGGTWSLVASANDAVLSGTSGLGAGYSGWGQQYSGADGNPVRMSVFGGGTAVFLAVSRLPLLGAG